MQMNTVRYETSRAFKEEEGEGGVAYLKDRINEWNKQQKHIY